MGLGEFQKELPINQISNRLSISSDNFASVTFFVSREAYPQCSCLSEGKTQREVKIKVFQPSVGLKHRFTLGRTHTCSKLVNCPPSQKLKTVQPKHDQLTLAKIS